MPVLDMSTEHAVPLQVHATLILVQAPSTALSAGHSHTGNVRASAGHATTPGSSADHIHIVTDGSGCTQFQDLPSPVSAKPMRLQSSPEAPGMAARNPECCSSVYCSAPQRTDYVFLRVQNSPQ